MLKLSGLRCGYFEKTVLLDIDAEIETGACLLLIGPNGAGKTTLLKTLGGILSPLAGAFSAEKGLYISSEPDLHDALTGRDLMEIFEVEKSSWADPQIGIDLETETLIAKPLRRLSSGERRRVFLSAAIQHRSSVLLLDEPTGFLDWKHAAALGKTIDRQREKGRTFLISSHDLNWALSLKDPSAWVLHQKSLAIVGKLDHVVEHMAFSKIFSVNVRVLKPEGDGTRPPVAVIWP